VKPHHNIVLRSNELEEKIVYFEQQGQDNTDETLKLALERAKARSIKKVILASTRGEVAKLAAERWAGSGIKLIVIPHQYGFGFAGKQKFPQELVTELEKQGHEVYFSTMLFHQDDFYGTNAPRALANILRTFCQGMKVCVEILLMAANGGRVMSGENVVVVAGSGRGADTAVVAIAAPSTQMNEAHITEIICKPFQTKAGGPPPSQPPAQPPAR
jgi:uncharacterized protein